MSVSSCLTLLYQPCWKNTSNQAMSFGFLFFFFLFFLRDWILSQIEIAGQAWKPSSSNTDWLQGGFHVWSTCKIKHIGHCYNTTYKSTSCFRNKLIAARGTKECAHYGTAEWRLSIALHYVGHTSLLVRLLEGLLRQFTILCPCSALHMQYRP